MATPTASTSTTCVAANLFVFICLVKAGQASGLSTMIHHGAVRWLNFLWRYGLSQVISSFNWHCFNHIIKMDSKTCGYFQPVCAIEWMILSSFHSPICNLQKFDGLLCSNQGCHVQSKGEKNNTTLWLRGQEGQDEDKVLGAQKV